MSELTRCTRCLLPHTFPFITFDKDGVCSYCNDYKKVQLLPAKILTDAADRIRKNDGTCDCIAMFSGGRDSSFLLHYLVKVLDLHPLVFTYEWGMSTPIGDENADNICKALCLERVIVDNRRAKKLRYIQLNVEAWLKKPKLGMIPLFTAGDKAFFTEVNRLAEKRGLHTVFIGTNPFERTNFKTGFCGIPPHQGKQIHHISASGKLKLIGYYLNQFVQNPAYINVSLLDSAAAFFAFYQAKQEQIDLFKYIMWNEETIDKTLAQYGWDKGADSATSWRIGDGTAAFYNYIYATVAGFTENDTLRSNQIREGVMDREDAKRRVQAENQPRFSSMKWYFDRINVDYNRAVAVVKSMERLY